MAKKYLSLEEAATMLGISQEALKKAREAGDVRGFADRGNWKFREEDLETYARERQVDSNPDIPILAEEKPSLTLNFGAADSNVLSTEDDDIGEQPTIIRKAGDSKVLESGDLLPFGDDEGASDSGVRLVLDSEIAGGDGTVSDVDSDSSHEIPISFDDSSDELELSDSSDEGASSVDIPISFGDSSHEMVLAIDDDDEDDSGDSIRTLGDSDSDVRLAVDLDDDSLEDSSAEILLSSDKSDSDVRLLGKTKPTKLDAASDSDVRLIKTDSDSDVKLVQSDSDSDVRLLPPKKPAKPGSDSDVSLGGGSKRSSTVFNDDEDEDLSGEGALMLGEASGIKLDAGADSGISLDSGSGISLDIATDSGIALDTGTDSDISLAIDEDDEGISLDLGGDSGIALDLPDDSGLSLDSASMEATIPLAKAGGKAPGKGKRKSDADSETLVAIPTAGGHDDASESGDTDFELGALEGESNSTDTSVLLFDDEEEADERTATMIKKKEPARSNDETFDLDAGEEFEDAGDDDDIVGEDDELEDTGEDFMADDGDFEESFSTGESQGELAAPTVGRAVAVEQEWGGVVFAMALLSTVGMLLCAGVMFDLVRNLWRAGEYGVVAGPLIQAIGIK